MKYILLFLLFKSSLFSQVLYLLPDDADNAIHYLNTKILKAEKNILIITDKLNNYSIKKSLIKAAQANVTITLISAKNDLKKQLALYRNINTREIIPIQSPVKKGKISMSIIIIDDSLTCKLSTSLEKQDIKHDTAIFTCNEDRAYTHTLKNILKPLIGRSTPYLDN
ncbi:MAG: hypothetical protein U9R50_11955 [Campylobacterota bacterium]|nr:hypothetical protein [Campylobacterota bacterium]